MKGSRIFHINQKIILVCSFICGYCSLTVKEVAGEVETSIGLCHTILIVKTSYCFKNLSCAFFYCWLEREVSQHYLGPAPAYCNENLIKNIITEE